MPACIISWASPTLRRNVDLPPWLAPVIMINGLPSASTSLPTARGLVEAERQGRVIQAAGGEQECSA